MALFSEQVSVTDEATALHAPDTDSWVRVRVQVPTGGTVVFLGGSDVTDTTGFSVAAGEQVEIELPPRQVLYAVTASGSSTVHVLGVG